MGEEVFVVQVVTDGDYGFPLDRVCEIGICKVDLDTGNVESAYSARIRLEPGSFTKKQKDYFERVSGESIETLMDGVPLDLVVADVKGLLKGRTITSFDISFAIKKFLVNEPWDISKEMTIMASGGRGIPPTALGDEPKNENLAIDSAYDLLFPDDEMGIGDGRSALDLALKSSFLMLKARGRC